VSREHHGQAACKEGDGTHLFRAAERFFSSRIFELGAVATFAFTTGAFSEMKPITGKPVIDSPELLEWPYDGGVVTPNLNDPTSNTIHDFHAGLSSCELVLSSEGNYHPALTDIWPLFLAKFGERPLQNWVYTTSPPVALPMIDHHVVQVGNLYVRCRPQVVVAGRKVIAQLEKAGHTEGHPYALYKDQGSVILVKKGNPKDISLLWDMSRTDVHYVSPNPALEPGAFGNYLATLHNIADNDVNPPTGMTATTLIDLIFNGASGNRSKWLAGPRIHHRDMPWSIAYGRADAGVIFYHLGLYVTQTFPDKFDIVPLGGTVGSPQPLRGTIIETRYVVRIKGNWVPRQIEARENLIQTLLSDDFTRILEKRGMMRPDDFVGSLSGAQL
jgi:hypothetical protein